MFIDKVRIYLRAGRGGSGCVSFRREKYVPFGGPNGGNGGNGGDIYLKAGISVSTLLDFTYKPHFIGNDGTYGMGSDKDGRSGEDTVVNVPCGTVVYSIEKENGAEHRHLVEDLNVPGKIVLAAKGGRGGRGNASFKTKINTAPRISEKGEPGEEVTLELELKLIADVGIVGCPNAGKSTLISRITAARPKIADYPFTTLSPNLGVCKYKGKGFVVADIPGLIEGAHEGRGLGDAFLRHIERTSILLHLVDISGYEQKTAYRNFRLINTELKKYSSKLAAKPMVVALNKIDLTDSEKNLEMFKKSVKTGIASQKKIKLFQISCATGMGIDKLQDGLVEILSKYSGGKCPVERETPLKEVRKYVIEPEFSVRREGNAFIISGKKVERFVAMTNFDQEESLRRLQNILKKMGVEKELIRKGINEGNTVKIGDFEFDFFV